MGDIGLLNVEANKDENTKFVFTFLLISAILFLFASLCVYLILQMDSNHAIYVIGLFFGVMFIEILALRNIICVIMTLCCKRKQESSKSHPKSISETQLVELTGQPSSYKHLFA